MVLKSKKFQFHHCKNLEYVDIDSVFSMVSFGKKCKYVIDYKVDDYKIKPLCIKASAYVRSYDGETKWMNSWIKDNDLLKEYNDIWNKLVIISEKNLTVSPSTTKVFKKPK